MTMNMKKLESMEQYNELMSNGKVMLLFSANWCPDCRFIEPFIGDIEAANQEYTFIYVDRDKFLDLCIKLDVFGIPSFIAFENGKELGRYVNKDRKTQEQIEDFIASL